MSGEPDVEDLKLWAVVTRTVRPLRRESQAQATATVEPPAAAAPADLARSRLTPKRTPAPAPRPAPPAAIEPNRHRRIAGGREGFAARLDLHGLGQDAARAALSRFLLRAADEGWRAVLVITGKGAGGDGVLRRRLPDWLGEAPLRTLVAGYSEAHRRHGGDGAWYVALKRQSTMRSGGIA